MSSEADGSSEASIEPSEPFRAARAQLTRAHEEAVAASFAEPGAARSFLSLASVAASAERLVAEFARSAVPRWEGGGCWKK